MTWEEICEDKSLQNLPYKIETNKRGQIVMSPASIRHIRFQSKIHGLLNTYISGGEVLEEASIETDKGIKVADVIWASEAFLNEFGENVAFPLAPALCIEVLSKSNTEEEMEEKKELYFSQGAREFWLCGLKGEMTFFSPKGELQKSELFPEFPENI